MTDHSSPDKSPQDLLPVSEFFEVVERPPKLRSVLASHAPAICVIVALGGVPSATKYINSKLGTNYSNSPVRNLIKEVAKGKVVVLNRDIIAVADSHPLTKVHLDYYLPGIRDRAEEQFTGTIVYQFNPRNRTVGHLGRYQRKIGNKMQNTACPEMRMNGKDEL